VGKTSIIPSHALSRPSRAELLSGTLEGDVVREFVRVSAVAVFLCSLLSPVAAQAPRAGVYQSYLPNRNKCADVLQLKALQMKDDGTIQISPNNVGLVAQFSEVLGWLEGYFTAMNIYDNRTGGDVSLNTKRREWMVWIYDYCKSNPHSSLVEASSELAKVLINSRH
jgi:hypothetical protein